MDIKKFIENNKKMMIIILVICVILFLGIPPLIDNVLFQENGSFSTSFTPQDILGYWGSFLAFLGTVALGGLALWQNHNIQKKNEERELILQEKMEIERINHLREITPVIDLVELKLISSVNSNVKFLIILRNTSNGVGYIKHLLLESTSGKKCFFDIDKLSEPYSALNFEFETTEHPFESIGDSLQSFISIIYVDKFKSSFNPLTNKSYSLEYRLCIEKAIFHTKYWDNGFDYRPPIDISFYEVKNDNL